MQLTTFTLYYCMYNVGKNLNLLFSPPKRAWQNFGFSISLLKLDIIANQF
jgi:hypothetical protein